MKKKIIVLFLLTAFFSTANATAADVKVTDVVNNVITVSGVAENPSEMINILILENGATLEVAEEDSSKIIYQSSIESGNDKSYTRNIKLDCGDGGYAEYDIYIGSEEKPEEVTVASLGMKQSIAKQIINTDKDGINDLLSVEQNRKILNVNTQFVKQADLEWVCGKVDEYTINSEESDFDGDSESVLKNIEKLSRAILECSLVDCYNNNRTDLFKDNDFLYNDILNFDKIDGVTGYNCYNNVLNDTGKKNVREMLLNNNFSNIEELRESFVKLTLYNGIHNDINSGGYGHMEQLFTNANIDYAKLNLPYYKALSDKYKVDSKIVIDNSINLNNFETKIEEYAKAASNGSLGTPGESSNSVPSVIPGAGSSASKSGISVNNINEKNNEVVESVFSDLTDTPWAEEAIISLYEKGILSGTGDGKFNPKQNMTREQAVKIVCEMQQFPESNMNTEFKDVDENSWYADYIKKAVENGIINGISQDEFGVGKNITRQDFVVIVYRALGAEEYKGVFGFSDSNEIADYAKEAVGYFANRGVISGYPDNTFSPNGNITRAEAAKIIYGIINEE